MSPGLRRALAARLYELDRRELGLTFDQLPRQTREAYARAVDAAAAEPGVWRAAQALAHREAGLIAGPASPQPLQRERRPGPSDRAAIRDAHTLLAEAG